MGEYDCPTCSKGIDTEHGQKVHHARVHGESLADYYVYDCVVCGETCSRLESEIVGEDPKYCSKDCLKADSGVDMECDHCGETFNVNPSKAEGRRFCDRECYRAEVTDVPQPE